jgi:hypothetical protein
MSEGQRFGRWMILGAWSLLLLLLTLLFSQWLENQKKQIRQEDYALKFQWQALEDRIDYYTNHV